MTPWRTLLVIAALAVATAASAQSVTLRYGEAVTLLQPGATAAFAINSSVAEASAADGAVRIQATGPGTTVVMVVTPDATISIPVLVSPPVIGMTAGLLGSSGREGTLWESSFTNAPRQLSNSFDIRRESDQGFQQLRATIATYFDRRLAQQVGLPQFSYETNTKQRDLTIGDQAAVVSPLTLRGSQLRGGHFENEQWRIHLGYAFAATYGGTFFTTSPEYVGGVTRRFLLSPTSSIAANVYYFRNPSLLRNSAVNGPVVSALYSRRDPGLKLDSEVAVSRGGIAVASLIEYDHGSHHVSADIRRKPYGMPGLGVDAQQGTFANIAHAFTASSVFSLSSSATIADYDLPLITQKSAMFSSRANVRLPGGWSMSGGPSFSYLNSGGDTSVIAKSIAVPIALMFARSYFSAGIDDSPTLDLVSRRRANGYGGRLGIGSRSFRFSGYYHHDVELPTLSAFFAQVPGLQDALERAGVYLTDVNQIIDYLRDTAFLVNLGFASGATFNIAPSRNTAGINASWTGERQRVDLNLMTADTELITGTTRLRNLTMTAAQRLSSTTELSAAASVAETPGGGSASSSTIFSVALRHRFGGAPSLAFLRRGRIEGYVFRDDAGNGEYAAGKPPIAGARVLLDDRRSTTTDAAGHFEFDGVSGGPHRVAVSLSSQRPFTFTTDSPRTAYINGRADFGVTFFMGKVFGRVVNDAAAGVPRVIVKIDGRGIGRSVETDDDGNYSFSRLPDGPYWISTVADSYPPGYALTDIAEDPVVVTAALPVSYDIFARALRSLSGVVSLQTAAGDSPMAGVEVSIPQLQRKTTTNAAGRYRFIDLPAGTFKIELTANAQMYENEAVLPAAPANISNMNFTVTAPK